MPLDIKSFVACEYSDTVTSVAAGVGLCSLYPLQVSPNIYNPRVGLVSLSVQLLTAVESSFGLVKPITPGTPFSFINGNRVSEQQGDPLTFGYFGNHWGEGDEPTYANPLDFIRQALLPGVVGNGFTWEWPEDNPMTSGLYVSNTLSGPGIILVNTGLASCADILVTMRWLEFIAS